MSLFYNLSFFHQCLLNQLFLKPTGYRDMKLSVLIKLYVGTSDMNLDDKKSSEDSRGAELTNITFISFL